MCWYVFAQRSAACMHICINVRQCKESWLRPQPRLRTNMGSSVTTQMQNHGQKQSAPDGWCCMSSTGPAYLRVARVGLVEPWHGYPGCPITFSIVIPGTDAALQG
jgi:hypothetical protein